MRVINWNDLALSDTDFEIARQTLAGVVHLRTLFQSLVRTLVKSYPWEERQDLVSMFDPSRVYQPGETIAFPKIDPQRLRPDSWVIGAVKSVVSTNNPFQGVFQVVTIDVDSSQHLLAAGIKEAEPFSIRVSIADEEDVDLLVSETIDTYYQVFVNKIQQAVEGGHLTGMIGGEYILLGSIDVLCGEEEQYYLADLFSNLPSQKPWLTTEEILTGLRKLDCLVDVPDEIARFALEQFLISLGFHDWGGKRWISPEKLEILNREIVRRMRVPVIQSRVAAQFGEDDSTDFADYEEVKLEQDGLTTLVALGEDIPTDVAVPNILDWQPPIAPIPLPNLSYLHLWQGYFPFNRQLSKAFDPQLDPALVDIQVIQGEPLTFLVDRSERVIKALDLENFRHKFRLEEGIPAGTSLWLEYQGNLTYRIAPRPLPEPRQVRCKLANMIDGALVIDEIDILMMFQGDPHLFKSEMRFEDMEALFKEAEQGGLSIFDGMWYSFQQLASLHPKGYVHYTDLFNVVFFQYRMSSPYSVVAELYSRLCFVPVGEGYFRFDPDGKAKRRSSHRPNKHYPIPTPQPHPGQPSQSIKSFIFQQSPRSEYADRQGEIYNWREGIPGSNQINIGSRFIYYLPGDKVFFGTGQIERIENYPSEDGHTYHNGHIADYQVWEPPLTLSQELGGRLSFIQSSRLWIGQAGIRQIPQQDFQTIIEAYQATQHVEKQLHVDENVEPQISLKPELRPALQAAVDSYFQDTARENILFCREIGHQRIRDLLSPDRIDHLTLDEFNKNVWQLGNATYQARSIPVTSDDWLLFVRSWRLEDLKTAYESGVLQLTGNQTWGSGSHIVGPSLKKGDKEKEQIVKESVRYLLYGTEPIEQRIRKVCQDPNGFGMNIVSGILHAMHPEKFILYNTRSVQALQKLGIDWTRNWGRVRIYWDYLDLCKELRMQFGFKSLTDVDWFMYSLAMGSIALPNYDISSKQEFRKSMPDQFIANVNATELDIGIWSFISKLKGHNLRTLNRHRPIHITNIDNEAVYYQLGSGRQYRIDRQKIEAAWQRLASGGFLNRYGDFKTPSSIYIAAILSNLPGVTFSPQKDLLEYNPKKSLSEMNVRDQDKL